VEELLAPEDAIIMGYPMQKNAIQTSFNELTVTE
jgi:hypothetical protein